jgi:hypothetical protein
MRKIARILNRFAFRIDMVLLTNDIPGDKKNQVFSNYIKNEYAGKLACNESKLSKPIS